MSKDRCDFLITGTIIAILVVGASMIFNHLSEGPQGLIMCALVVIVPISLFIAIAAISRLLIPDKDDADKFSAIIIIFILSVAAVFGVVKLVQFEIQMFKDAEPGCSEMFPCEDNQSDNMNGPGYHGVDSNGDGTDDYIRSNPDNTTTNNLGQ